MREDGGREMRSEDEALRVSLLHLLTRVPQLCLFCTSNSLSTYCYKNDIPTKAVPLNLQSL